MPFVEVPGATLYYEVHGAGPWLVFAHGAGGNHLSWWQQIPAFAGRFRCLIYDQRGWGRSACRGAPDPASLAPDLVALLDHLEAEEAALVGQSMGGWAVLGCALSSPGRISHLVLTSTLAGLADAAVTAMLVRQIELGASQPIDGRAALAADFPARDPVRTFLFEQIAALNPPLTAEVLRALVALRYRVEPAALRVPVCFIAGERDRLFPLDLVRQAHAKLPGAELIVVPEAGHSVYFERPREFNRTLAACLGGGDSSGVA
jgi:3-oxoadipate enol-lactonase